MNRKDFSVHVRIQLTAVANQEHGLLYAHDILMEFFDECLAECFKPEAIEPVNPPSYREPAEYAHFFSHGQQIGKLLFANNHFQNTAYGKLLIYILPTDNEFNGNIPISDNLILVYNPSKIDIGKQWVHKGPWQEDIQRIINDKIIQKEKAETILNAKQQEILDNY